MILLASAKTMKTSNVDNCSKPIFERKSNALRAELKKLDYEQMAAYFKIKGKTLENTFNYYSQPISGKVITSLDGAVFKQIRVINDEYIKNNVYIIDAMYGILNGHDKIDLFRLDFNSKAIIEQSYYNYWREDIHNFIESTNHQQLLVLTSEEYTKVLNLEAINKDIFQVEFEPAIKSSVHKKQARGKIANYCIANMIDDYTLLDNIVIDEYALSLNKDNIIFITRNEESDV